MRGLILIVLVSLAGCGPSQSRDGSRDLLRYHDDQAGVTCWSLVGASGLSCLPDQANPRQQASTPAPRRPEEVFQL